MSRSARSGRAVDCGKLRSVAL